jgi:hypothetical protein
MSKGVLAQYNAHGKHQPVALSCEEHSSAKENYEMYDEESGAIVKSVKQWKPQGEVSAYPIKILTDYKNLEYFMTSTLLNRRQRTMSEIPHLF